jgi:histidine ammonia-lyase
MAHSEPIYGINTSFGSLCNVKISMNFRKPCKVLAGKSAKKSIVKLMLLLKIQSLGYGHSGIQLQTVNRLIAFFLTMMVPVYLYTRFKTSGI